MMSRLIVWLLCLLPVSAWAEYLPLGVNQGSTTSGQIGVLTQGAVSTSPPSYTNGQTNPLSLTPSGELRMRLESSAVGSPSDDDDGTIAAGSTSLSKVLVENYAYNSDSGTTAWTRWSHQTADYDSGAGTENLSMIGLALPGSGGPVAGGTSSNPFRTDPTGTTTQPVSLSSLPALATGANVIGAVTQSGAWTVQPGNTANTTAWLTSTVPATSGGTTPCYITSAATNNATNCKASAGQLYGFDLVNTTATIYYLRLYNLASSPTCSSATGFVRTIPIPASTTGGGIARSIEGGEAYGTGLGFCLTAGGSSTDNTSAATGVYVTLNYK